MVSTSPWPLFEGKSHTAVTNVGTRPTVSGTGLSVETHLLEHTPRGTTLHVWNCKFLHRLRNEHKFPSVDELKKQIAKDIQRTQAFLWIVQEVTAEPAAVWLGQHRLRLSTWQYHNCREILAARRDMRKKMMGKSPLGGKGRQALG